MRKPCLYRVTTPIMEACRCCRSRLLFFKFEVRPRSCRSYHIWRPCSMFLTPSPWTHFYGPTVTPIPYKMKKYIKMKERYVTIIKKKKMWRNWKKWKKNERNERNERYIPFIPLISFHSSVYWDRFYPFCKCENFL